MAWGAQWCLVFPAGGALRTGRLEAPGWHSKCALCRGLVGLLEVLIGLENAFSGPVALALLARAWSGMRSSRPRVEPCLRRPGADAVSPLAGDMIAAEPPGPDLGGNCRTTGWAACRL